MFGILTADLTRCQGRYGRFMGSAVLAKECTDCMRRTWPDTGSRLSWIAPPAQRPCPERIDPAWYGVEE